MAIPKIPEESAGTIEYDCYDKDNAAEVPTTIHYRIDDVVSGAAIRASTQVVPAQSSGEITLYPADTTLQDQENESELRILTMTLDTGLDSQFNKAFLYEVFNLRVIT